MSDWVYCTDVMPKNGTMVLVAYVEDVPGHPPTRPQFALAEHAGYHQMEQRPDAEGDLDYDEEANTYFVTEGWYAQEVRNEPAWKLDGVYAWMAVPPRPEPR